MSKYNKQAPGDNPGFVYLIRRGPFCKIGHTSSIFERMKTFSGVVTPPEAHRYPIELIWSLRCSDQITTERALHQRLTQYHAGTGEWFYLPDDVVDWLCQQTEASICEGYDPTRYRRTDSTRYR